MFFIWCSRYKISSFVHLAFSLCRLECPVVSQINWLHHWPSPVDFAVKSTCDGAALANRHDCRRKWATVIPSLTSDGFVELSKSNRNSSHESSGKSARVRQSSALEEMREHLHPLGRRRLSPVKRCINMEMTQRTLRSPPPGLPSHLPPSHPVAPGRRYSGQNAAERVLQWADVMKSNIFTGRTFQGLLE